LARIEARPACPAFAQQLVIGGDRVAICLSCLKEDCDGEKTAFPRIGRQLKCKTGDALVFANITSNRQPDPLSLHAGLPVTRGHKWLLSQWARDRVQAIV
jgi:prolyl 4-hydroxylase